MLKIGATTLAFKSFSLTFQTSLYASLVSVGHLLLQILGFCWDESHSSMPEYRLAGTGPVFTKKNKAKRRSFYVLVCTLEILSPLSHVYCKAQTSICDIGCHLLSSQLFQLYLVLKRYTELKNPLQSVWINYGFCSIFNFETLKTIQDVEIRYKISFITMFTHRLSNPLKFTLQLFYRPLVE